MCYILYMIADFPKEYKGFELISIKEVPDCAGSGIYLRHKKTGLEVFHLCNDDAENLFSFSFRTPIKNSSGAAHILEHSVLCGSEKFPLKEPFTNMLNQSVNTFLNAMTYPDKTVYPASSVVKNDYFNLMDVYADAVFFPLLKKETFMQEARRLEINEKEGYEIQGVVYNEMKGSYSSFDSVASDIQIRSIFPDTNYSYDSGGDPLEIPNFTYEDFLAFHKKYYNPQNCLLFLYGNIPLTEQLDFLNEILIPRLEKKYPQAEEHASYPFVSKEIEEMESFRPQEKEIFVKQTAPAVGSTGSLVTVNWNCGQTKNLNDYMECAFLSELLIGNDGSPLSKALLESELGDDMAPISGAVNETRNFSLSFGLHGVKKGKEKKVYKVLFSALDDVFNNGVDRKHLEAAIMSAEFSNREVSRSGGPYSLVLLDRALNSWNYGNQPADGLLYREAFENVRKAATSDPNYIQKLLLKYIYQNKNCVYVTVQPSANYIKERDKKEKELVQKLSAGVDREQVKKEVEALHSYQQYHETEEDVSCIPSLKLSDLSTEANVIKTEFEYLKIGAASQENAEGPAKGHVKDPASDESLAKSEEKKSSERLIPFVKNIENTNGISYLDLAFPLDGLSPEDYIYLPLFCYAASSCGWKGKNWSETSLEAGMYTGGLSARLICFESSRSENSKILRQEREEQGLYDRDWLIFSVRMLSEKLEDGIRVFEDYVTGFDFSDEKRLKNLLGELKSGVKASVAPHGNRYAGLRVQAFKSHCGTVDEITKGFTQVIFLDSLSEKNIHQIALRLENIKKALLSSGCMCHLTADRETFEKTQPLLEKMLLKSTFTSPCKKVCRNNEDFIKQILLKDEKSPEDARDEYFVLESQVGFAAASIDSHYFAMPENVGEIFLSHWLSVNLLWERIRTTGGAYGAYASSANLSGLFIFASYRDPSPVKSLQTYLECLKDASEISISEEECRRSLTGTYGDEVQPASPQGRGRNGLLRFLGCISDQDRSDKLKQILSLKPEDLNKAAAYISENSGSLRSCLVCTQEELDKNAKNIKKSGVIVKLPL